MYDCSSIDDIRRRTIEAISLKQVLSFVIALSLVMTLTHSSPTLSVVVTPLSSLVHDSPHEVAANYPISTLTYTSLWNTTETIVKSGDSLSGDHIVLHLKWSPSTDVQTSIITVNATVVPMAIRAENTSAIVSIDTRSLGNNFTCTINMTAILTNGSFISTFIYDVFIGNFFTPSVQVISPNGGELWTGINNITWIASDKNVDEHLVFDVLVSSDAGRTMMLLASDLNQTWYEWDCSDFTKLDTYLIMVRVFDGIYTASDTSDDVFTAGEIPPISTSTSTTTTPSTSTTPNPPPIEGLEMIPVFLVAVVISSGVMALFVYYSARRWI